MVTHDPRVAAHADRIIFLKDGTIVDETLLQRGAGDDGADRVRATLAAM
jgi:putative ABC transport system ATP-binding protein